MTLTSILLTTLLSCNIFATISIKPITCKLHGNDPINCFSLPQSVSDQAVPYTYSAGGGWNCGGATLTLSLSVSAPTKISYTRDQ